MRKPVKLLAKSGLVTLYIGRWPFRYKVQWNLHDGEDAANYHAFINGLMRANQKGSASSKRNKRKN